MRTSLLVDEVSDGAEIYTAILCAITDRLPIRRECKIVDGRLVLGEDTNAHSVANPAETQGPGDAADCSPAISQSDIAFIRQECRLLHWKPGYPRSFCGGVKFS